MTATTTRHGRDARTRTGKNNFDPLRGCVGTYLRGARWVGRAAAVALVALVASCGAGVPSLADGGREDLPRLSERWLMDSHHNHGAEVMETRVLLEDGRELTCLVAVASGTGITCDWPGAR